MRRSENTVRFYRNPLTTSSVVRWGRHCSTAGGGVSRDPVAPARDFARPRARAGKLGRGSGMGRTRRKRHAHFWLGGSSQVIKSVLLMPSELLLPSGSHVGSGETAPMIEPPLSPLTSLLLQAAAQMCTRWLQKAVEVRRLTARGNTVPNNATTTSDPRQHLRLMYETDAAAATFRRRAPFNVYAKGPIRANDMVAAIPFMPIGYAALPAVRRFAALHPQYQSSQRHRTDKSLAIPAFSLDLPHSPRSLKCAEVVRPCPEASEAMTARLRFLLQP